MLPRAGPRFLPKWLRQLGLTGTFTKFDALQETWPNVGLSQFDSGGGSVNSYSGSDGPTWEYADSFTWITGRHTIGFGVDYRHWHLIRNLDDDFYGDWSFSGATIQPTAQIVPTRAGLCGTGNAVADMLLGYYNGVGGFVPAR